MGNCHEAIELFPCPRTQCTDFDDFVILSIVLNQTKRSVAGKANHLCWCMCVSCKICIELNWKRKKHFSIVFILFINCKLDCCVHDWSELISKNNCSVLLSIFSSPQWIRIANFAYFFHSVDRKLTHNINMAKPNGN